MEYKNSLNLPKTDFAMKADLVVREPRRLESWQAGGLYEKIQAQRAGGPKFVLHDGPPFANGDVHIGTALNKILKDFIIKHKTLSGFSAPYVPGWDCHGLPIEFKVVQELRKKAGEAAAQTEPAAIRRECAAYARKYIDIQRTQFKRLGVLGDWENPYLTLKPGYEADELRLFADLVEKGFVYRGKKPVYWSIPCRTALAEAEVEYQDHISQSIFVKFPVVGRPGLNVVIWTTTPWTLPANLAIAYNSTFNYNIILAGEESYIVAVPLLSVVAEKCGWEGYQIIRTVTGDELATLKCKHPFCNRTVPLLAGDAFVESSTGSGFVHIAPGHGLEDYGLGREHGLPIFSPVDDNGCLCHTGDMPVDEQMPASLVGKSILEKNHKSEANEAVLDLLKSLNMLLQQENYSHSYPHCWRSKTPVIFRAMDQWFIKVDHQNFRDQALAAIGQVNWVPDWGKNRIEAAVAGRPDWCISRQRCWGVPIPAFYNAEGQPMLDARIVRKAADLFEREGSNAWFEKSAAELWTLLKPSDWTGPEAVAKSTDTLDVWIDSGSSSRSVMQRREELHHKGAQGKDVWQADIYLEGSDQHRGWFQSSLLLSLGGNGAPPFKTVLTHGFMVDADREKISKSKQGGYEKPQTSEAYVKKYGADVVRLWVASQDYRNDIVVSEERINKVGEIYRVIRNALRYQLSNLYDFDPAKDAVPFDQMTPLDRWVLDAFSELEKEVVAAYEAYEFHVVYQRVSQFVAVELSAVYHDVVKDRLYTDPARSLRRRSTQTALHYMVRGLCQMLSPVLAFTADEAWEFVPGVPKGQSVHETQYQPLNFARGAEERAMWEELTKIREAALPVIEKERQSKNIGKSLEAQTLLITSNAERKAFIEKHAEPLRELVNVSRVRVAAPGEQADWQQAFENRPNRAEDLIVLVRKADGHKCERCWRWEPDTGAHAEHPTLCGRCIEAVKTVA